ncbi:MAG: sulfite exporter TauE/SafE family protein [Chloroflexaceae bacterium]|nr:sulfite exporter TauE/SafE family protein [Chloroflexaceae bacterium]
MNIEKLLTIFLVGMAAQLVDGTLGMGYGVTSSTLLISLGIYPALVSASVHMAEVVTSLVSGAAHLRLGNTHRDLWVPLALAGMVGGVFGAVGLVTLPLQPIRIIVGVVLLAMGAVIVYRFIGRRSRSLESVERLYRAENSYSRYKLVGLGLFAACIDALGGGGWGPICTPSLVVTGSNPRSAVGSVNLAEFFVTVAITITFIILVGFEAFRWDIVLVLILAGLVSAPLSAWLCRRMPQQWLGILIGLLIIILSVRTIVLALVS